jgi:hypothetical protein
MCDYSLHTVLFSMPHYHTKGHREPLAARQEPHVEQNTSDFASFQSRHCNLVVLTPPSPCGWNRVKDRRRVRSQASIEFDILSRTW